MTDTCQWSTYTFNIHDLQNPMMPEVGCVYIIAKRIVFGWDALYVGKAENLRHRFSDHHRIAAATARGATAIHWMPVPFESLRQKIEADLILQLQPPLNRQGVLEAFQI